jgi:hypothetical protein
MWHETKSIDILASQNNSKFYVINDVYIIYTTILGLDYSIINKMIVNHFTFWYLIGMEPFKMFASKIVSLQEILSILTLCLWLLIKLVFKSINFAIAIVIILHLP